jgi:hypothetical protein
MIWRIPPEIIEEMLGLVGPSKPTSVRGLAQRVAADDRITKLIVKAWNDVFGSTSSPDAGYQAAVRAVEAAAAPLIMKKKTADLSRIIDKLGASKYGDKSQRWGLPTVVDDGGLSTMISMMTLISKSQYSRHGADPRRPLLLSLEETQWVVPLAETLVRWFRMGLVRQG